MINQTKGLSKDYVPIAVVEGSAAAEELFNNINDDSDKVIGDLRKTKIVCSMLRRLQSSS